VGSPIRSSAHAAASLLPSCPSPPPRRPPKTRFPSTRIQFSLPFPPAILTSFSLSLSLFSSSIFFHAIKNNLPPSHLYLTLIFFLPARRLYLASLSSLPDFRWKVRFSDGESLIYRGDVLAGGNYAKASASITDGEILKPFTGITGEKVESGGGKMREYPRFPYGRA
jgi:hypothetical protein